MALKEKIGLTALKKSLSWGYNYLLGRKQTKNIARSFITGIKLVDANGLLVSLQMSRPESNLHEATIGNYQGQIAEDLRESLNLSEEEFTDLRSEALQRMGMEGDSIGDLERMLFVRNTQRFLSKVDDRHFPDEIYTGNVDKIGQLNPEQADAVSEFYATLRTTRGALEDIKSIIDEEDYPTVYVRVKGELNSAAHIAEQLADQRETALRSLGADEDEFDDALTIEQLETSENKESEASGTE